MQKHIIAHMQKHPLVITVGSVWRYVVEVGSCTDDLRVRTFVWSLYWIASHPSKLDADHAFVHQILPHTGCFHTHVMHVKRKQASLTSPSITGYSRRTTGLSKRSSGVLAVNSKRQDYWHAAQARVPHQTHLLLECRSATRFSQSLDVDVLAARMSQLWDCEVCVKSISPSSRMMYFVGKRALPVDRNLPSGVIYCMAFTNMYNTVFLTRYQLP